MAFMKAFTNGSEGGNVEPETTQFTIAYGTPVVLNFNNPHTEFVALKSDGVDNNGQILKYIISDSIKNLNGKAHNWQNGSTSADNGGIAWTNGNKTLTLTMPRNYYAGTYDIVVF